MSNDTFKNVYAMANGFHLIMFPSCYMYELSSSFVSNKDVHLTKSITQLKLLIFFLSMLKCKIVAFIILWVTNLADKVISLYTFQPTQTCLRPLVDKYLAFT